MIALQSLMHRLCAWLDDLLFHDRARLVEILSLFCIAGFWREFVTNPMVFEHGSLAGFAVLSPQAWVVVTGVILVWQAGAFVMPQRIREETRFIAMVVSFGFWLVCAISFSGMEATNAAAITFSAISFVTLLAGLFLAWKIISRH